MMDDVSNPTTFSDDPSPRPEHAYREKVADALHTGADKAREWGERGPDRTSRPLRRAGDGLDAAAHYLETHDLAQVCDDVSVWAKRNPGAALAVAAATGFCIGIALFRGRPDRVIVHSSHGRYAGEA